MDMNKYKVFGSVFALLAILMPAVSFADGVYYSGNVYLNEAAPVRTTGYYLNQNSSTVNSGQTGTVVNSGAQSVETYNTSSTSVSDIFGIHIKSKAERDAEKAAAAKAAAEADANARVARNNDGTFAYGYTDTTGAQYFSGARYVDARNTGNRVYSTASSGFLPNSTIGWIFAIALIGILVYFVRKLKEIEEAKKNKLPATA